MNLAEKSDVEGERVETEEDEGAVGEPGDDGGDLRGTPAVAAGTSSVRGDWGEPGGRWAVTDLGNLTADCSEM